MNRLLLPVTFALGVSLSAQCELDVHAGNSSLAGLGSSVAVDGHRVLTGAPYHVFQRAESLRFDGSQLYEVQDFVSGLGVGNDSFGRVIDLQGNVAVVSAGGDDQLGTDAGAVYVYRLLPSGWVEEAKLGPPNPASAWFGESLSLDGDVIVVSAAAKSSWTGEVYAFRYDGSAWNLEQQILAPVPTTWTAFGYDVEVSGNRLLIGAPYLGDYEGSVFEYGYDGSAWVFAREFAPLDLEPHDRFGFSLDLEGDRAVIGAAAFDVFGGTDPGAVYEYEWDGSAWSQLAKLVPADATGEEMQFGFAVSLEDDVLAVGAPFWGDPSDFGRVYLYGKTAGTWALLNQLAPASSVAYDRYGTSVDIDRDLLVVGAPGAGSNDGGAVYAYSIACSPTLEYYGCSGADLAGSLVVLDGDAALGSQLLVGLENPLGTQTAGATATLLAISTQPAPGFPCGLLVPGWGPGGAETPGELLISIVPPNPGLVVAGPVWEGVGLPAAVPVAIPSMPTLQGLDVYMQGVLIEPLHPTTPTVLTSAVRVTLGS